MTPFINKLSAFAICFFILAAPALAQAAAQDKQQKQKPATAKISAADEQKTVLDNFAAWDGNLKTLSLSFEQSTSFEGTEISASSGRLYKKDNNIRLDTLQKGKVTQSAVTDKKIINILDEKGKLITQLSWQEWQAAQANKALFDFGNYKEVLKTHKVKEFGKTEGGYKLVLTPAASPAGEGYLLEFLLNDKDYFPMQIAVSNGGTKTQTVLNDIRKNIKLEERIFK